MYVCIPLPLYYIVIRFEWCAFISMCKSLILMKVVKKG